VREELHACSPDILKAEESHSAGLAILTLNLRHRADMRLQLATSTGLNQMAAVSRHFSKIPTRVPTRAGKVERAATGRSPYPGCCHLHLDRKRGRGDRRPYFRPVNLPGKLSVVDGSLYRKSHADRNVEGLLTLSSWLRECASAEFVQRAFSCQCDLVFCWWWWRMSGLPGERVVCSHAVRPSTALQDMLRCMV
jgi:hypothetical protein